MLIKIFIIIVFVYSCYGYNSTSRLTSSSLVPTPKVNFSKVAQLEPKHTSTPHGNRSEYNYSYARQDSSDSANFSHPPTRQSRQAARLSLEREEALIVSQIVLKMIQYAQLSIRATSTLTRRSGDTFAGLFSGLVKSVGGVFNLFADCCRNLAIRLYDSRLHGYLPPHLLLTMKSVPWNVQLAYGLNSTAQVLVAMSRACIWGGEIAESLTLGIGEAMEDSFAGLEILSRTGQSIVNFLLNHACNESNSNELKRAYYHNTTSYSSNDSNASYINRANEVEGNGSLLSKYASGHDYLHGYHANEAFKYVNGSHYRHSSARYQSHVPRTNDEHNMSQNSTIDTEMLQPEEWFCSVDINGDADSDCNAEQEEAGETTVYEKSAPSSHPYKIWQSIVNTVVHIYHHYFFLFLFISLSLILWITSRWTVYPSLVLHLLRSHLFTIFLILVIICLTIQWYRILQNNRYGVRDEIRSYVDDAQKMYNLRMQEFVEYPVLTRSYPDVLQVPMSSQYNIPDSNITSPFNDTDKPSQQPSYSSTNTSTNSTITTTEVEFERLHWGNIALTMFWNILDHDYLPGGLRVFINSIYEDMLNEELSRVPPGVANLRLREIDLGSNAPIIQHIRTLRIRNQTCSNKVLQDLAILSRKFDHPPLRSSGSNSTARVRHHTTSHSYHHHHYSFSLYRLLLQSLGVKDILYSTNTNHQPIYPSDEVHEININNMTNTPISPHEFLVDCDRLVVELSFVYASEDMKFSMSLRSSDLKSMIPELSVEVTEFTMKGKLNLTLSLTADYPFLGDMMVSFQEIPTFDFVVSSFGGIDWSSIPLAYEYIHGSLSWLLSQFTAPYSTTLDLRHTICPSCDDNGPNTVSDLLSQASHVVAETLKSWSSEVKKKMERFHHHVMKAWSYSLRQIQWAMKRIFVKKIAGQSSSTSSSIRESSRMTDRFTAQRMTNR